MARLAKGALCASLLLALVPAGAGARRTDLVEALRPPSAFGTVALAAPGTLYDGRWARIVRSELSASSALVVQARRTAGLTQLRDINRAVNQAVAWRDDRANWRSPDYWATGRETLARGAGDCEDYAIAKMQVLRAAGFPAADLFLVVGLDLAAGAPHAMLLARVDGDFWALDNLHDEVRPAATYSAFRPILSFNANGRWLHGYRSGQGPHAAPAAAGPGTSRLTAMVAAQGRGTARMR